MVKTKAQLSGCRKKAKLGKNRGILKPSWALVETKSQYILVQTLSNSFYALIAVSNTVVFHFGSGNLHYCIVYG